MVITIKNGNQFDSFTPMSILDSFQNKNQLIAILIDPEKFETNFAFAKAYLNKIPTTTTHLLVGGSTDPNQKTQDVVQLLKKQTSLPILLFPGSHRQITDSADGILFLSLLSGRNPDFLIGQQVAAAPLLAQTHLEVIPTGYLLLDGGSETAVARVSETKPIPQPDVESIVNTALAGEYMGKACIYLEAGSGAKTPVQENVITAVRKAISIPLIVGGGIRTQQQMQRAFVAGATMVVIGTAFEEDSWEIIS